MTSEPRLTTSYEGTTVQVVQIGDVVPAPLTLHRAVVPRAWVDYNEHMSESCYLLIVGDSSDALFRYLGIDEAYRDAGHSLFTAETHVHYLAEGSLGDELHIDVRLLDADAKRVHLFHEIYCGERLLATVEQMLLHVDTQRGAVTAMPADLQHRLAHVVQAHSVLSRPAAVGHVMRIPRQEAP